MLFSIDVLHSLQSDQEKFLKHLINLHSDIFNRHKKTVVDRDRCPRLSQEAKRISLDSENEILLSTASFWELAMKSSWGKLTFEKSLEEFVEEHVKGNDIHILNIELPHLLRVEQLPFFRRDPFDRLLISQSTEDNFPLIGSDEVFDRYKVNRIWQDT